ncbi:sortase, marine proteobacterial type [Colwellia sp. 39_35_sub15_T18]|nr:sortase, marine proteobacterial type [Colwellia sp. 39_35_sub15_T18]
MKKYSIWLIFAFAICLLVNSFYMVAKAHLAQVLLDHTWQNVLKQNLLKQENKKLSPLLPWAWADFHPVAKLTFLRFGLSHIVLNTDSGQALAFGPGLTGANASNIDGMTIISGHNDSHFKMLEALKMGDKVLLEDNQAKRQYYRIDNTLIIDTRLSQLHIEDSAQGLVLVTCYPFGGVISTTPYRFVVQATPIDSLALVSL